jgi:hypothetical protein
MFSVFFLLPALSLSQQLTPIPSPSDGFLLGPLLTNFTIDVFYDHLCVNSKNAFPGLYQYWQNNQNWLGLRIHVLPLPYHHYSFVVAQAGRYIQQNYPAKFMSFVSFMFQYQNIVLNGYTAWTLEIANLRIAGLTNQATGVPTTEVVNALSDDTINYSSRLSYKYAGARTMTGTPLYLINDVWVPSASTFTTSSDWSSFFQSLS